MTNRVGQYGISNEEDADFLIIQEAVDTLKSLGKAKVYPYGNGQICFHHNISVLLMLARNVLEQ
jgi:hypothetical protein